MTLTLINEFQIDTNTSKEINELLQSVFADIDFRGRDYFKQLPHYRLLAQKDERLVGHLGIDYRVMNLNGHAVKVFGVIDLCVSPAAQGQGIGKQLMLEFEAIAQRHANKIDFLFLVTDTPNFYAKLGYQQTKITTTWLKIDHHENYGLDTERIEDALFMIKPVSDKQWADGDLDMLGYMY